MPREALARPTRTFKQLCAGGVESRLDEEKVLLEPDEFLKLIKHLYETTTDRPTLQLYSSPRFKLLLPPIHKGGHISYYLNPEHTERLGVVLYLRDKLHMPLQSIRKVIENYPADYYRLILNGVLTEDELLNFPALLNAGFKAKDVVFYRIAWLLGLANKEYWELIGQGRPASAARC